MTTDEQGSAARKNSGRDRRTHHRSSCKEKRMGPYFGATTPAYKYEYEYDLAGNRKKQTFTDSAASVYEVTDYFYNAFNQLEYLMNPSTEIQYQYDLNGNRKDAFDFYTLQHTYYTHDSDSRLAQYQDAAGTTNYEYDHSGRLISKSSGGIETRYYYDGINLLMTKEKPAGGSCFRTKTVNALKNASIGQVMASRTYNYSGTSCTPTGYTDTWYKYNDKGDPVATVDDAGNMTSRIDMEAFGKVHTGGQYPGPRLTTKEVHLESGLYYFGARWYDSSSGQWISAEPVRLDGPNYYIFNFNNPVNRVDVDGFRSEDGMHMNFCECMTDCIDFGMIVSELGNNAIDNIEDRICGWMFPNDPVNQNRCKWVMQAPNTYGKYRYLPVPLTLAGFCSVGCVMIYGTTSNAY